MAREQWSSDALGFLLGLKSKLLDDWQKRFDKGEDGAAIEELARQISDITRVINSAPKELRR